MESAGQDIVLGVYLPSILGNHKENKLLIKKPAIVRLKRCNYGLERLDAKAALMMPMKIRMMMMMMMSFGCISVKSDRRKDTNVQCIIITIITFLSAKPLRLKYLLKSS